MRVPCVITQSMREVFLPIGQVQSRGATPHLVSATIQLQQETRHVGFYARVDKKKVYLYMEKSSTSIHQIVYIKM